MVPDLVSRIPFKLDTVTFWDISMIAWALPYLLIYQNIPVDLIFSCPYQGVSRLSKELCFLLVENGIWKSRPGH